jgi:hypothetical protein
VSAGKGRVGGKSGFSSLFLQEKQRRKKIKNNMDRKVCFTVKKVENR